jgi:16S rRNA (guanine(527)-N(7))-methyltransferase RsmG
LQKFGRLLQPVLEALGLTLAEDQLRLLERHFELLLKWNRRMSLTGIRGPREIVLQHFGESLFLWKHLPPQIRTLADVGSGAGFPGFPIAVASSHWTVTLVESSAKKTAFLKEVARGVTNVKVHHGRIEHFNARFDCIAGRGVALERWLRILYRKTRWLALLTGPNGARTLSRYNEFEWRQPIAPPWESGRLLLVGCSTRSVSETDVPRETYDKNG